MSGDILVADVENLADINGIRHGTQMSELGSMERLKVWACNLKRDVIALWLAAHQPRVPWYAKVVSAAVAASALSPIDLIVSFCPIDRAGLWERFHAQENNLMLTGAFAFAAIWASIPILKPLGLAARLPRIFVVLERGYQVLFPVRPQLQRFYAIRGVKL